MLIVYLYATELLQYRLAEEERSTLVLHHRGLYIVERHSTEVHIAKWQ